jgi:carbon monoxide dehydrogenase subunit G
MEIESEFVFDGPRDTVWRLLHDPAVLAKALPGTRRFERTSEDQYEGEMEVSVGPVTAASFSVKIELTDKVSSERFTMLVDGRGNAGFTKGAARVQLLDHELDRTLMRYRAELQVGGRIAAVGQRLLDSVGKSMTRQGLEAINHHLQGREPPRRALIPRPAALALGAILLLLLLLAVLL